MFNRAVIPIVLALVIPDFVQARDLDSSYSAVDIEKLQITVGVGEIRLESGSDDAIRVEIELKPSDDAGADVDDLIDAAELVASSSNGRLELQVVFPGGGKDSDIQQDWRVYAPQALGAMIEMGVGVLDVSGLEGGVEAKVGVGETRVDVPGGALRLNTSVGEVSVHNGAKNIGDVDLDSNIGEVSLRVDGNDIESERSMFVGSRLSWSGDGEDDIDVRVNVGEIVVRID